MPSSVPGVSIHQTHLAHHSRAVCRNFEQEKGWTRRDSCQRRRPGWWHLTRCLFGKSQTRVAFLHPPLQQVRSSPSAVQLGTERRWIPWNLPCWPLDNADFAETESTGSLILSVDSLFAPDPGVRRHLARLGCDPDCLTFLDSSICLDATTTTLTTLSISHRGGLGSVTT